MSTPTGYESINSPLRDMELTEQIELENQEQTSKSLLGRKTTPPVASASHSTSISSIFCSRYLYFTLGYVFLVVAMVLGFYKLKLQNDQLSASLVRLQNDLNNLKQNSTSSYVSLKDNVVNFEDNTNSVLATHTSMLIRLTNGTSNADVLDKLKQTQSNVDNQMATMQSSMQSALEVATKNVSDQLALENLELQKTQSEVTTHLNVTMLKMEKVVSAATQNIYAVQQNVSQQLNNMKISVSNTVQTLNEQVQQAQDTIHDEVETVKTNINQYVTITNKQFAAENDFVKYQLAGTFTLLGCLISMWHLTSHWRNYAKPDVQRRVMAVLWMVPIYSITSWLSLVIPSAEPVLGAIRDCYEAYAIYTFIALLIAILEDGRGLQDLIETITKRVVEERQAVADAKAANGKIPVEHIRPPFPCCYVYHRPTTVAAAWLFQCKLMAMQFVMLKPLLTIIPLILTLSGYDLDNIPWVIGESINWKSPKLYILFLQNTSVAVAFWGLLCFYHGTEKELEWCDPWPKFLCIKGVVFATFWQSLTIQTMSSFGLVDAHSASQVQNLLICIEMLIASLAHFYIFPYEEWADNYKREKVKGLMLRDTLALRDFVKDMRMMVTSWDTNSTPVKNVHNSSEVVDNEIEDDENQHLLKGSEATFSLDIESGPYYQSIAVSGDGISSSTKNKRRSRGDSVDSNDANVMKQTSAAEREALELARRALMEKLHQLEPELDSKKSRNSEASSGNNSGNLYGNSAIKRKPSADSEKLSSYLATEDMPPIIQQIVGDGQNVTTRYSSSFHQPRRDGDGFELLPRFAEDVDSDEGDSAVFITDHHSPISPMTRSGLSQDEKVSEDSDSYDHATV